MKLRLSLIAAADGTATGFFTYQMPFNSAPNATYKLNGRYAWGVHQFQFTAQPLGSTPPHNSTGHITGSYVGGSTMISGSETGGGSCSSFHATRNSTESPTNQPPALEDASTQPPAKSAPSAANGAQPRPNPKAGMGRAPVSSPVAESPAPTAAVNNGLVRKSPKYWGKYRSDIIRQVFDGGFGYDVDEDTQFRILFATYVEMYSKSCRAYLPADHQTVTLTEVKTKRDKYGNVVSEEHGQPATVEVDSRFANKYRQFSTQVGSSASGLAGAVGIMSGKTSANSYFDPGNDMEEFFQTEKCQSAAMRQMGENLLRGAKGNRSLQQSGGTIPSAEAETDKSAPAGFTHIEDACNAFYRDPANERFQNPNSTAYCKCLGQGFAGVMSKEEEAFYSSDFRARFRNEIAQPHSDDPAWQRLHPVAVRCMQ